VEELAAADFNHDGKLDLVAVGESGPRCNRQSSIEADLPAPTPSRLQ
jgi:hypothetical protein